MIPRVKGTQDFLDLSLFNYIVTIVSKHVQRYRFTQIATPIVEHTELFTRSLGEQTDVVSKEMFIIEPRTQDSESICLRPEATAATVRAFVQNKIVHTPWKVFSYGPMFRYERPQKGRYRQFHQINIEVIGSEHVAQDVQVITMLDRLFHETFKLNNYALQLNFLGCFTDRKAYKLILQDFLNNTPDICTTCKERKDTNSLRVFDCKNPQCQELYQSAPKITEYLCEQCQTEWTQLKSQLELLSVSFVCNPGLVRGLDYYNKTVFEFVSNNLGAQNAFCGGGRYAKLVEYIGGKVDKPSIGAAIGIDRLLLLLEEQKEKLNIAPQPALHVILPLSEKQQTLALLLADELCAKQYTTDVLLSGSLKKMMKRANSLGATYVLLIGDEEQQQNEVMVKHMVTGAEERVKQSAVVEYLKK